MHRPALALGFLLACGGGPPERRLPPPIPGTAATPTSPTNPPTPIIKPPPDTPAARDLTAICESLTTIPPTLPPPERFHRALDAIESTVSQDSAPLVQRLHARDLAEASIELRTAATAAEVFSCPLAEAMDAVAAARPNLVDAQALLTVFEALLTVSPEYKDRILAAGCSELPACGRECSSGLAAAAEAEPTQRAFALMRECAAFRATAPQGPPGDEPAFAWIRARVAAFADASAEILPPADAARLAELRKNLQI